MNNIDLGTFEWDMSKIEEQLIQNRQQIEQFSSALQLNKKALNEEKKEIQELAMKISAMKAVQQESNKQLQSGKISQEEYNKTITDSNKAISDMTARTKEIANTQAGHIKTIIDQERAVKELRLESGELNKLLLAGRTEIEGNESAYRNLNKELNALKTEAKNLGAQLVELKRAGKENTDEYSALEARWKDVSSQADKLNDEFKELDKAVGDNQRSVGDYKDQIIGAWGEIISKVKSGDLKGAFDSAKEGMSGLFNLIKTNPWILVLTGIAAFVKEMWEYNEQTKELNKTVEQLANTSGAVTDELRKNALAIQETYGKDFNEAVLEQNALIQDFGVSAQEAFDIYNNGLALGGATNAEFGDSIREYGSLFAQNGYSAQEFINILNSGIDLGIYNDKLPDAIKEAGLALKENTKATRDALVNAFGATFADDILSKVSNGSMTVKTALEEISKKAKEAHLNEQQLAQLTADVFKGAGEDAGGVLKVFEAINKSQKVNYENLTDLQKATIELAQKNKELEEAKDQAFKSDVVMSFQQDVIGIWKDIKIWWYKSLDDITGFFQDAINGWRLGFMNAKDFIAMVPQAFRSVVSGMKADFQNLGDIARTFGAVIKSAFTFDIAGVESNFNSLMNKVRNFQSQTKVEIGKVKTEMVKINTGNVGKINAANTARANQQAYENAQKEKNNKVTGASGDATAKASADAKKAQSQRMKNLEQEKKEREKAIQDEIKRQEKLAQETAQRKVDIAKNELAEYIALNSSKLESDKKLNAERYAEQLKYYEDLKKLKESELYSNLEKELLGKSEADKQIIRQEYATKQLELNNEINDKKAELNKSWQEQQDEEEKALKALKFQQDIIDLEEQGATEYEIEKERLNQQREQDLADLEQQRTDDLISKEVFEANKKLIEAKYNQDSKQMELEKQNVILSGYANLFGNISQLLGQNTAAGKAAAIAEATITGYQNAIQAYNTALKNPISIANPAYPFIQAGISAAFSVAQIAKIASTPTGKKAAQGMLVGPSHANGGIPIATPSGMIEAEGGEIIINKISSALFRDQLSAINQAGGGIKFASGGVVPSSLSSVQNLIKVNQPNVTLDDTAVAQIASAIYAGSQSGITDLSENRRIAENANF